MITLELGITIATIGCIIGVLGYLAGRDKKIAYDAEWRGMVNGKLDVIVGVAGNVEQIQRNLTSYEGRICTLESSMKAVNHRIDANLREKQR